MLEAMKSIAESRSRERMMKESRYASETLRFRLVSKDESVQFSATSEPTDRPAYQRRKASQGKGDL